MRVYYDYALMDGAKGTEDGGDPIDLCKACWFRARVGIALAKSEGTEALKRRIAAGSDPGPEGDDHPSYNERDYTCENCNAKLDRRDE